MAVVDSDARRDVDVDGIGVADAQRYVRVTPAVEEGPQPEHELR
jgi:hypothetical protein